MILGGRQMSTQWYIAKNGARRGPYSGAELRALVQDGEVRADDLVWCDGMPAWLPARNVLKPPRSAESEKRGPLVGDDEPEEVYSLRRARSAFPGKLVSPGFFLFAILMFLLPWVEVRCNGFTAASQSGLQSCFGTFTEAIGMAERHLQNQPGFAMNNEHVKPAPLMWLYGMLILMGFILGLALPVGVPRLTALGACAILAFVIAVIQLAIGFPIADVAGRANADVNLRRQIEQQPFPMPMPIFGPQPVRGGNLVWISTTPWFWFGILMTLGVTGALALEHVVIFAQPRHRRRADD
jgi:hypothetical protein